MVHKGHGRPELAVSLPHSVAEVIQKHVTLEVECIDRMYLNVYIPALQRERGVVSFFRFHRGETFASSALMDPISKGFIRNIASFCKGQDIPLISFEKKQRKDDVAAEYLAGFSQEEGVLFVGKAQEKTPVFRTEKRRNPQTGQTYPWIVRSTAMVNHYYFYCVDKDFGPFFLKFCSYFPYTAKLCLNGHEYLKRQLNQEGIGHEALDNGILSCVAPQRVQQLADRLSAGKIDGLLRKWLARLPHPFTAEDRRAGYRYELSILQAEFSLTQVLDLTEMDRKRIYVLAGCLTLVGIFAMRWNVVIGGQMFSKSFRGLTTYKMELMGIEGLFSAMAVLALPVIVLAILIKVLPPWDTPGAQGPSSAGHDAVEHASQHLAAMAEALSHQLEQRRRIEALVEEATIIGAEGRRAEADRRADDQEHRHEDRDEPGAVSTRFAGHRSMGAAAQLRCERPASRFPFGGRACQGAPSAMRRRRASATRRRTPTVE